MSTVRVALVDDDALVRSALRRFLSLEADLRLVGEAGDGGEALQMLQSTPVDVLLLDVSMPRMDGFAVLRELRVQGHGPRVLMLSGDHDPRLRDRALQEGAFAFLQKAADPRALVAAIRAAAPAP